MIGKKGLIYVPHPQGRNNKCLAIACFQSSPLLLALSHNPVSASPYDHGRITAEDLVTEKDYSPYVGRAYPVQVLFGDSHFHTNLSFDAGLIGTSLTAQEGYRFARGEKVISNTGQPVQLVRPLDFLVLTDHAEINAAYPQERLQPRIDFVVSTEGRDLPTCRRFLPSVEMTWLGVRG